MEQQVWIMLRDVDHLRLVLWSLESTAVLDGVALLRSFAAVVQGFSFFGHLVLHVSKSDSSLHHVSTLVFHELHLIYSVYSSLIYFLVHL